MAPELIHPVSSDDLEGWQRAFGMTLLLDVASDDWEIGLERRRRSWPELRTWGVRDRGAWVATLATMERSLTVPGTDAATRDLAVDALTAVTVGATHRRRGLLRAMLTRSLQAAADRGDAMSILVAAEWPIYGRFGYAPAVHGTDVVLRPRLAGGVTGADPTSVRPVDLAEASALAPSIFARARKGRAGQVDRRARWWDSWFGWDGTPPPTVRRCNWFVHEGPDGPDGMLAWRVERDFDLTGPLGKVGVREFFAATKGAYVDLWGYLAGLDAVEEVALDQRAVDEPIRLMLGNGRALETEDHFDYVWLRLLDVPAALLARGYACPGELVLEVVDDAGPGYAAGRYELTVQESGSYCTRTSAPAQLRLSQQALAAAYLGGNRLAQVAIAGGVEEVTAGALARADLMFSTPLAPWNQTGF